MANVTQHIHIERPELWTLQLQVEPGRIFYTLHNRHEANSLTWGEITLDEGATSSLKAVEDAVYDNPALLDDFGSVNILVHSEHFVVMPHEQAHESALFELLAAAYPDMEGEPALDTLPQCGVCIAFEAMTGLIPFLQRTFNMPAIHHHLHALCEHFCGVNSGSSISRMFLNLRPGNMDMVVYTKGRLEIANTFRFRSTHDAAFFALQAWECCHMDRQRDELQLAGDRRVRDELAPELRRFIAYVMPAIYPARAMQLSHDAMQAPIDLIYLALCE